MWWGAFWPYFYRERMRERGRQRRRKEGKGEGDLLGTVCSLWKVFSVPSFQLFLRSPQHPYAINSVYLPEMLLMDMKALSGLL